MNRIINPNAPVPHFVKNGQGKSALDDLLRTMSVIASYRQHYLDLSAEMQRDGITATDIVELSDKRANVIRDMAEFIIYGEKVNVKGSDPIKRPSIENTENHAPQLTETPT